MVGFTVEIQQPIPKYNTTIDKNQQKIWYNKTFSTQTQRLEKDT